MDGTTSPAGQAGAVMSPFHRGTAEMENWHGFSVSVQSVNSGGGIQRYISFPDLRVAKLTREESWGPLSSGTGSQELKEHGPYQATVERPHPFLPSLLRSAQRDVLGNLRFRVTRSLPQLREAQRDKGLPIHSQP